MTQTLAWSDDGREGLREPAEAFNFIYCSRGVDGVNKDLRFDQLHDKWLIPSLGRERLSPQLLPNPDAILEQSQELRHSPLGNSAKELIPIRVVLDRDHEVESEED